jgi:hypothetical protein
LIKKFLQQFTTPSQTAEVEAYHHVWKKELEEQKTRYVYYGTEESEAIKLLRDNELSNPAPFSNRTLIEYHNFDARGYESPIDFKKYKGGNYTTYQADVPVLQIIGAGTTNNLNNYQPGLSYQDILFKCLHGGGLNIDSLKFLSSNLCKSNQVPHKRINNDRKTRSEGELTLNRFGDYFISSHGHQRTIMAMYWIWQQEGANGMLKNVRITEWFPNYKSVQ